MQNNEYTPEGQYYLPPTQTTNYTPFPQYYGHDYSYPAMQFFEQIRAPDYPLEIIQAAQRVTSYFQSIPINLNNYVGIVNQNRGLTTREDQLVAFLLQIQRELPLDCRVKADISTLILYNMMKSYLRLVPVLENTLPHNMQLFMAPSDEVMYLKRIIKTLLAKMKCCQQEVLSVSQQLAEAKKSVEEMQYAEQQTNPTNIQVRLMEPTTTPVPNVVTEIRYIEKPCPTLPPTTTTVATTSTTESPYLVYVDVVPKPANAFEKTKYDKLIAMLKRKDLSEMLGNVDLSEAQNDAAKLSLVLKAAAKLEMEQSTIDAIRYYLSMSKSAAALNLSMQKEIRKQFELTKIFTATFDFESLSLEAKSSFDSFFNFLLGVTGEQMSHFTTWTEAHTKGEFIKMLFGYFLEQDFTPIEVKENVHVLEPYILMTGEGAEPI